LGDRADSPAGINRNPVRHPARSRVGWNFELLELAASSARHATPALNDNNLRPPARIISNNLEPLPIRDSVQSRLDLGPLPGNAASIASPNLPQVRRCGEPELPGDISRDKDRYRGACRRSWRPPTLPQSAPPDGRFPGKRRWQSRRFLPVARGPNANGSLAGTNRIGRSPGPSRVRGTQGGTMRGLICRLLLPRNSHGSLVDNLGATTWGS
jgi:hypothetical protein